MTVTGILVALLMISLLMVMAVLSTSVIYAVTQLLSLAIDYFLDLGMPSSSRH